MLLLRRVYGLAEDGMGDGVVCSFVGRLGYFIGIFLFPLDMCGARGGENRLSVAAHGCCSCNCTFVSGLIGLHS